MRKHHNTGSVQKKGFMRPYGSREIRVCTMAEWRHGSRCRKLRDHIWNCTNEAESNLKVVGAFLTLKALFSDTDSSNKVTAPELPPNNTK